MVVKMFNVNLNVQSNNEQVLLSLSILDISKIEMYEYWYEYKKPRYGDNEKLCYTDMDKP